MFLVKNILWIKDFDFDDGSKRKDKLMVVLYVKDSDAIIAPLPTSVDKVPDVLKIKKCIKEDDRGIHAYYIKSGATIGENGFSFDKDTFIHVHSSTLKYRSIEILSKKYLESGRVKLMDKLTESEYSDILYCIYKSRHIPIGLKRDLESIIQRIEANRTKNSE